MIRRTACLIARENDLLRNLAIEKHLMDTLPEETAILYLWQNRRAILLGRNQDPWSECAVGAFLSSGGQIARRLSGGGTVYQDMGSLNFTFILPKSQFDVSRQLSIVGMAAGAFGLQPRAGRQSSLTVNGRTFAQSAFYKSGAAAYHHGTIHFSTDLEAMSRFMGSEQGDPSRGIVNLGSLVPTMSMNDLQEALYWAFARVWGAQPSMLDERLLHERSLASITQQYADSAWTYPRVIPATHTFTEIFPWGRIAVLLRAEGGVIRESRLYTDAMEAGLFPLIEKALTGAPLLVSAISARIDHQLSMLRDPYLLQIADDVDHLIQRSLRGR